MKPHPNTDSDLTSLGEVLFQMGIDANRPFEPMTRADYIEHIAEAMACVVWIDSGSSGRPVWASLPDGVKNRYRKFAEFVVRNVDPIVVDAAIKSAADGVDEWMNGPGEPKRRAPTTDEIVREGILRYRGHLLEPEVRA